MKFSKLLLVSTVAAAAVGLHGCTEGDETSIVVEGSGGGGPVTDNPFSICPDFATSRQQTSEGDNVCQLPTNVTSDITLTADTIWYMNGRVTVGNGNGEMTATEGTLVSGDGTTPVLNVTVEIEPGTQIIAAPGFSNMIITRGSKIMAEGTATAPIIFSSEDEGFDGNQEWGGLILHGYGNHNQCTAGTACNIDAEGESGFAGGFTPDDDSGVLRYVIVAEGGFEFAVGNEINGISFVGVGSGTTVEYIQVHGNFDDGVEFYGGAVNAKYVVLTANGDESLDWDEGYVGNIQYLLAVQAADEGDYCVEADTEGAASPLSIPTIANATFVCDGDPEDAGFRLKAGTGGFFHHTIIDVDATAGTPDVCMEVEGMAAQQNATANPPALDINQFICDAATFETDATNQTNNIQTAPVSTMDPALNALYAATLAAANGITPTDFAAFNASNSNSTAIPDFLDQTDYIGAVDPDATSAWWEGWTLPGTL